MGFYIDCGYTNLPCCTICDWRGEPTRNVKNAIEQAKHHAQRAHPADKSAAAALRRARRNEQHADTA